MHLFILNNGAVLTRAETNTVNTQGLVENFSTQIVSNIQQACFY